MHIVETTATTLPLPPRLLSAIAIDHAFTADFGIVDEPQPGERASARVYRSATYEIWLIRWGTDRGLRTVRREIVEAGTVATR